MSIEFRSYLASVSIHLKWRPATRLLIWRWVYPKFGRWGTNMVWGIRIRVGMEKRGRRGGKGMNCVRGRICVWIRPADTQVGHWEVCDAIPKWKSALSSWERGLNLNTQRFELVWFCNEVVVGCSGPFEASLEVVCVQCHRTERWSNVGARVAVREVGIQLGYGVVRVTSVTFNLVLQWFGVVILRWIGFSRGALDIVNVSTSVVGFR